MKKQGLKKKNQKQKKNKHIWEDSGDFDADLEDDGEYDDPQQILDSDENQKWGLTKDDLDDEEEDEFMELNKKTKFSKKNNISIEDDILDTDEENWQEKDVVDHFENELVEDEDDDYDEEILAA